MQRAPKTGDEKLVPIASDRLWQTVFTIPVVEEQRRNPFSGNVLLARDEPNVSPQPVSDCQQVIEPVILRQGADKLQSDVVEATVGHRE